MANAKGTAEGKASKGSKGKPFCFEYESKVFHVEVPSLTAAEIKVRVGQEPQVPLALLLEDGMLRVLGDGESVDFTRSCSLHRVPRFRRGRLNRIEEEFERFVRPAYPGAALDGQECMIVIPKFGLPAGLYDRAAAMLAIRLNGSYPESPPDGFLIEMNIRFRDGRALTSCNPRVVAGGHQWLEFSWHAEGHGWRPAANPEDGDHLGTYLNSIRQRLGENR